MIKLKQVRIAEEGHASLEGRICSAREQRGCVVAVMRGLKRAQLDGGECYEHVETQQPHTEKRSSEHSAPAALREAWARGAQCSGRILRENSRESREHHAGHH